jgi:signal peptidase
VAGTTGRRWLHRSLDVALIVLVVAVAWYAWPMRFGGSTSVVVVGGHSMEPTYDIGDLVLARAGTPEVGDVVVFDPPLRSGSRPLVIHRIVGGGPDGWITQGDGNPNVDPWQPTDADVVGIARGHLPGGARFLSLFTNPLFFAVLAGLAVVVLAWPRQQRGPSDEDDEGEDDDGDGQGDGEAADVGAGAGVAATGDPRPRRRLHGLATALVGVVAVAALSSASAASLAVDADDLGAQMLPDDRCDTSVNVEPGHSGGDPFTYDQVTLTDVDAACAGRTAQVAVRDEDGFEIASGTAVAASPSFVVVFAPPVAIADYDGIAFAVDGWGIPAIPVGDGTTTHIVQYDDVGGSWCAEVTVSTTSPVPIEWTSVIDLSTYPLDGVPYDWWWDVDAEFVAPTFTVVGTGPQQYVSVGAPVVWGFCANRPPPPPGDVTYELAIQNDWGLGYCAVVTVSTESVAPVTWVTDVVLDTFPFDGVPYEYHNATTGGFVDDTILAATGVGWNSQVQVGVDATWSYCANRTPDPPDPSDVTYSLAMVNDWGAGYCADVTVTTTSPTPVVWEVEVDLSTFPFNGTPGAPWNAVGSFVAPVLTASGPAWAPTITLGSPATFGFCATRP